MSTITATVHYGARGNFVASRMDAEFLQCCWVMFLCDFCRTPACTPNLHKVVGKFLVESRNGRRIGTRLLGDVAYKATGK